MIYGILHPGSGPGDQLFSYIATRVRAADLGVGFSMVGREFSKMKDFMDLDYGEENDFEYHIEEPARKLVVDSPHDLYVLNNPNYDPEFNFIPNGSVIDGYGAQDIKYFGERLDEVRQWLKVTPLLMDPNVCVINFRGGEFAAIPELFLPKEYWDEAIDLMKKLKPGVKFEVHTDDPALAKQFFPDFPITQDIGINWRSVRYARNLIISNSAFAVIPSLLGGADNIIAPRYWARRNIKQWSLPSNYYRRFQYI